MSSARPSQIPINKESRKKRTLIDTDSDDTRSSARSDEALGDGCDIGGVQRNLRGQLGLVHVRPSLDVKAGPRQRVEQDGCFQLRAVRRAFLDLDERVLDHHLAHRLVRLEGADSMTLLVRLVVRGLQGGKEVSGIDDHGDAANLTETERGLETRD